MIVATKPGLDLADSLMSEIAEYRTLLELLRAEQEALRMADADALAQVAQAKLKQVYTLQDIGIQRAQAMRHSAPAPQSTRSADNTSGGGQSRAAHELWETLVVLAADAQRQNALNRRLASVQQRHVDRAMAALWGAAGRADTYGSDGRTQHHSAPRPVASI